MKAPKSFQDQIREYERRDRLAGVQRRFVGDIGKITTKEATDEYRRGYALAFDCPRGKHEWVEMALEAGIIRACQWCDAVEADGLIGKRLPPPTSFPR